MFAEIRGRAGIISGDAIHLACAAEARVDLFLTHDKRLAKKIVPGIQFIATLDTNIL
jgi:predicted nucleic acid-binding protein